MGKKKSTVKKVVEQEAKQEEKLVLNFGGASISTSVHLSSKEVLSLVDIINDYLAKLSDPLLEPSTN